MISSRMALTGLLFIDLTSHTLEEKWTAVAYLHVYKPLLILIVAIKSHARNFLLSLVFSEAT